MRRKWECMSNKSTWEETNTRPHLLPIQAGLGGMSASRGRKLRCSGDTRWHFRQPACTFIAKHQQQPRRINQSLHQCKESQKLHTVKRTWSNRWLSISWSTSDNADRMVRASLMPHLVKAQMDNRCSTVSLDGVLKTHIRGVKRGAAFSTHPSTRLDLN